MTPMDSLIESVVAKRDELAKLEQQVAERKARIAAAQQKPPMSMEELMAKARELRDAQLGPPTPDPPRLTEAEQRANWEKTEAARSEMQLNAPCGFDAGALFPDLYPEQERWRPKPPEQIAPEPTEEIKRPVKAPGVGSAAVVEFSKDSKMGVRVLSQPDAHGFVKCTPCSGMMVGHVVEISVQDFAP